jgi:UDPglucose--hexose-1-phosphate uridylyltransferase
LPELRIDPLSGRRVIVAGERGGRPGAFLDVQPAAPVEPDNDPFLEGHEDRTPPEVYALRPGGGPPDSPGWLVRVVPNLYPALSSEAEDGSGGGEDPLAAAGRGEPELFSSRPAVGSHEVVVNAPDPVPSLVQLDPAQVEAAMSVWRERMRFHSGSSYVHLIVNEGKGAGASLSHTHAQLYALPFVPAAVARERERFTAYSDRTQGRNLLEDLLQEEVRRRERLVAVDDEAVAICPFAAEGPFHFQILPRKPAARFEDEGPLGARMLHQALSRLQATLGALPPLNMWLRTAPRGAERFCWRLDVVPRLANLAGLEMGTGVHLNVLPPEQAAQRMRSADV